MEFSGRLASFPMAELLSWAYKERFSGSLVVRRSRHEKRIYFQDGSIIACLTDEPAEFYGRMLLLNGYLDQPTLLRCLSLCKSERKRLDAALREHNILPSEVIESTLKQQIEDVVCDVFLWRHGFFFFQADLPPAEEILSEPLDPVVLALQGSRWNDEMRRIRQVFPHHNTVLRHGASWPGENMTTLQAHIAREVNGDRTLEELHERLKGSYFRFMSSAFELEQKGVLEIAVEGQESMTTSLELSLFDLLLEQAAEEQILYSQRHVVIPFEVLERYVPIWVKEPDPEDLHRIPEQTTSFYQSLDGKKRLGELLASDHTQRSQETELLLLELRQGAVALLPSPISELEAQADETEIPESERWWRRLLSR